MKEDEKEFSLSRGPGLEAERRTGCDLDFSPLETGRVGVILVL